MSLLFDAFFQTSGVTISAQAGMSVLASLAVMLYTPVFNCD